MKARSCPVNPFRALINLSKPRLAVPTQNQSSRAQQSPAEPSHTRCSRAYPCRVPLTLARPILTQLNQLEQTPALLSLFFYPFSSKPAKINPARAQTSRHKSADMSPDGISLAESKPAEFNQVYSCHPHPCRIGSIPAETNLVYPSRDKDSLVEPSTAESS